MYPNRLLKIRWRWSCSLWHLTPMFKNNEKIFLQSSASGSKEFISWFLSVDLGASLVTWNCIRRMSCNGINIQFIKFFLNWSSSLKELTKENMYYIDVQYDDENLHIIKISLYMMMKIIIETKAIWKWPFKW